MASKELTFKMTIQMSLAFSGVMDGDGLDWRLVQVLYSSPHAILTLTRHVDTSVFIMITGQ